MTGQPERTESSSRAAGERCICGHGPLQHIPECHGFIRDGHGGNSDRCRCPEFIERGLPPVAVVLNGTVYVDGTDAMPEYRDGAPEVVPRSVADSLADALSRIVEHPGDEACNGLCADEMWHMARDALAEYRAAYPREETYRAGARERRSERFEVDQYADGQIYITENGAQMLHAQITGQHETEIQIPVTGKVTIDKLYGPTVFWDIRVSCDIDTCEWVIERSMGPEGTWKEWCRIPGQLDEDFSDG